MGIKFVYKHSRSAAAGPLVERELPEPGHAWTLIGATATSSDSNDWYAGLDRFGRVIDHRWTTSGGDLDRYKHAYDPNGNRLYRENTLAPALSELYHDGTGYDDLDRLTSFGRGVLDANKTGLAGPVSRSQTWSLDALGNWKSVTDETSTTQNRTHDKQNRLTQVVGDTLAYSPNGEMTTNEGGNALRATQAHDCPSTVDRASL